MPGPPNDVAAQPASQPDKPSRLKAIGLGLVGLGLCFQFSYFLFFSRDPCQPSSLISLLTLLLGAGIGLAVIGLGLYAKANKRHIAIGVWGLLPLLGPILVIVSIGLSGLPFAWIIRPVAIVIILLGSLVALILPGSLQYGVKSRQVEARTNLGAIYIAERAFFDEHKRFGNFDEIGFALTGTSNRYTYRIDRSGAAGTVIPNRVGPATDDNTVVPSGISPGGQGFTATATANLDADGTIDQWHVNDLKHDLQNADTNDSRC